MERLISPIYASVLALSAFLVFWIQPLVARMVLPTLGGAPAVWNTCVVFFQSALLLGYLYSHLMARFPIRAHSAVHLLALAAAITVVPGHSAAWIPPADGAISAWLLKNLTLYIGLPFLLLTSTAPLLQHWFGASGSERARDPYYLYAASNAGSFVALISFPVLLERFLPVTQQIAAWRQVFLLCSGGIIVCLLLAWRRPPAGQPDERTDRALPGAAPVLLWLLLAFVPSSLMLGVTTHVTTDIAAVSLLWVMPLALYLATFIAAFSEYGRRAALLAGRALPVGFMAVLFLVVSDRSHSLLQVPVLLAIVGLVSMVLHGRLYALRPPRSQLTGFYVAVALGGLLGGVLNGLLAPVLFDDIIEFPIIMLLALLLVERPMLARVWQRFRAAKWAGLGVRDVAITAAFSGAIAVAALWGGDLPTVLLTGSLIFVSLLAGIYAVGAWVGMRLILLLCFATYLTFDIFEDRGIHSGRSFFGSFTVRDADEFDPPLRLFTHGTTVHGIQAQDPELALSVVSYYTSITGLIDEFLQTRQPASIGVTGLGAGNLACLGRKGDTVTFFEIDPWVEDVAREYFTYLDDCPPETRVVLGDARISLADVAPASYDLLILDAFSSDSVPIHLLTNEAADSYERVLRDDGLMIFHISNRYLDLAPVLARMAAVKGWRAWKIEESERAESPLTWGGTFVVIAPNEQTARFVADSSRALALPDVPDFRLWTDDYSNLLDVLRWSPVAD